MAGADANDATTTNAADVNDATPTNAADAGDAEKGKKNLLSKKYQAGVPSAAASSAGPSFPDSPAGEDVDFEDCQDEGDCAGSDEIDFDTYFEEPPEEPPAQTPEPAHKKPRHHKFMTPRPKKHPGASTMRQSQKTHVYVEDSDDEKRDDPLSAALQHGR